MSNLERRVATALTDDLRSTDIEALIRETERAIVDAEATVEAERKRALDPVLSPDAHAARETMASAEFARERLRKVLPRLQARCREIADAEYFKKWHAEYETLKARRDGLAIEFRETYPAVVETLVDLLNRMGANNAELSRLHQTRQPGVSLNLIEAELVARGLDGFSRDQPSIAKQLMLPKFEQSELMAWPPRRV
jgi:hypothetical protein